MMKSTLPAQGIAVPLYVGSRKTYMTGVEGENTRLRNYLARLHRKTPLLF